MLRYKFLEKLSWVSSFCSKSNLCGAVWSGHKPSIEASRIFIVQVDFNLVTNHAINTFHFRFHTMNELVTIKDCQSRLPHQSGRDPLAIHNNLGLRLQFNGTISIHIYANNKPVLQD